MPTPVTIGIPVFNGAATLRRAIESALQQTHPACIIRISDNASTDRTPAIAREFVARYSRVIYKRQLKTLGPGANFESIVRDADTEYFMWLAADDYIEPTYVERTLAMLEADPGLVACVSRVRLATPAGSTRISKDTFPLSSDPATNLAVFLSQTTDNSRFYGLHRVGSLLTSAPRKHFHGYDWSIVAGTLLHGRYGEVPDVLMTRDENPDRSYANMVRGDIRSRMLRVFPLTHLMIDLFFRQRIPLKRKILKALAYQHIHWHIGYVDDAFPSLKYRHGKLCRFWWRYIAWRLITSAKS